MMIKEFTFFLSLEFRSVRTRSMRSFRSFVCFADYCFIAYLLPPLTLSKTSSTRQVHQICVPAMAIIPRFSKTHWILSWLPYLKTDYFMIL